uniref:Uncharacterized protein n=1 Tax=Manihot esculenta TaxID=3983 RepID=A0A199U9U5_MANES
MGINNLVEEKEKALLGYGYSRSIDDSLEERVSVFLDQFFDDADPSLHAFDYDNHDGHDDHDSFFDHHNTHVHNSMERTIFWESQEALLQVHY